MNDNSEKPKIEEDDKPVAGMDPAMEELIRAAEEAVKAAPGEGEMRESEVKPEEILKEIEHLKTELDEERERILRVSAEFDNYRKRAARDLDRERGLRVEALIRKLIPVLDNLGRALTLEAADGASIKAGVELTLQSFKTVLSGEGVEKIPALGKTFDPNLHEALAVVPQAGAEPGIILEEFEAGYTLAGLVLRPSRVKIAGKPQGEKS